MQSTDIRPQNPRGRTRANVTLGIGIMAFLAGLMLVVAPGKSLLFYTVPTQGEFIGIIFALLGLFNVQEAQNQKRYLRLMARLRDQSTP